MSYYIQLTNVYEDSYNQQHKDGPLSEFDVNGKDYNEHKTALFDCLTKAEDVVCNLEGTFNDSPILTIEEV